jgi:class 3 adenylate cyclase
LLVTLAVASVFGFTIILFLVYNHLVEKRQQLVLNQAAQSTAIVSSMFPKKVRDRLLQIEPDMCDTNKNRFGATNRVKSFLSSDDDQQGRGTTGGNIGGTSYGSQIADLFPHCTVLFADIVGFTAWSSTRSPDHVFILLQTIYHGFDQVAKRRKVFKVETIGDCYLAVTGLPEPQVHHATIMSRFAWECRSKMNELTRDLEVTLGPDCSDLRMRFGMHSGPVTAGVLRGDRARFQLFGDTVNTAARMESTGVRDRVQISHVTADLLTVAGKAHWMTERQDVVDAKGKGGMRTFWLNPNNRKNSCNTNNTGTGAGSSTMSDHSGLETSDLGNTEDYESKRRRRTNAGGTVSSLSAANEREVKQYRLYDWMVDLLLERLKHMVRKWECLLEIYNDGIFHAESLTLSLFYCERR